jgi:hypothetical protein
MLICYDELQVLVTHALIVINKMIIIKEYMNFKQ